MGKNWIFNKNIVITGTSSGIGKEVAKLLASKYFCNVYGSGRNLEKLEKSKQEIDSAIEEEYQKLSKRKQAKHKKGSYQFSQVDVSSFESFSRYKKELDDKGVEVDVVINNAGIILPFEKFETESIGDAKRVFETNFYSHVYSYKLFCEDLKKSKGALFAISSSSALCPIVGQAVYSASKAAIKNFTEAIKVEHKKDFFVGIIYPGYVRTDLFRDQKEMSKLVLSFSMKADKMAKKIVRAVIHRKSRSVLGADAVLMKELYKFFPRSTQKTISDVLEISRDKMFDKVYTNNPSKREKKK